MKNLYFPENGRKSRFFVGGTVGDGLDEHLPLPVPKRISFGKDKQEAFNISSDFLEESIRGLAPHVRCQLLVCVLAFPNRLSAFLPRYASSCKPWQLIDYFFRGRGCVIGMIGTYHRRHFFSNVLFVAVCRCHQASQLLQEIIRLKRNGSSDVDQIIFRLSKSLFGHPFLFIQFFHRAAFFNLFF